MYAKQAAIWPVVKRGRFQHRDSSYLPIFISSRTAIRRHVKTFINIVSLRKSFIFAGARLRAYMLKLLYWLK
jgi:hypothetical protein